MWQKVVTPYVEAGELTVVGVVQEQHPDRASLYRQWRKLDWPIFVDSLNLLDLAVVPVPVALDRAGFVRHKRITPSNTVEEFIKVEHPAVEASPSHNLAAGRDPDALRAAAQRAGTARAWRDLGDALFLHGAPTDLSRAVEAYERAVAADHSDGRAHFRLGVTLLRRYESRERRASDAQAAVERWGSALAIDPNQYIWRRRIQQYGPRLDKPYNFYFWVEQAKKEITARGE